MREPPWFWGSGVGIRARGVTEWHVEFSLHTQRWRERQEEGDSGGLTLPPERRREGQREREREGSHGIVRGTLNAQSMPVEMSRK